MPAPWSFFGRGRKTREGPFRRDHIPRVAPAPLRMIGGRGRAGGPSGPDDNPGPNASGNHDMSWLDQQEGYYGGMEAGGCPTQARQEQRKRSSNQTSWGRSDLSSLKPSPTYSRFGPSGSGGTAGEPSGLLKFQCGPTRCKGRRAAGQQRTQGSLRRPTTKACPTPAAIRKAGRVDRTDPGPTCAATRFPNALRWPDRACNPAKR